MPERRIGALEGAGEVSVTGEPQPAPLGVAHPQLLDDRELRIGRLGIGRPLERRHPTRLPSTSTRRMVRCRRPAAKDAGSLGVAIVLLAINLRPAVGSVGVVLDALRGDLGMSVTTAGLLTTLPVLCFAAAGIAAHSVIAKLGLHVTTVLVLALAVTGIVVRSLVDSPALFLVFSVVALSGCAIGNILLPPLAKRHFPDNIAGISAAYGAALMGGGAISSLTRFPSRRPLGTGGGARPRGPYRPCALLLWLPYLRDTVHVDPFANSHYRLRDLANSRLAWAMALLFGVQSAQAYAQFGWLPAILVDAGLSDSYAGAMLGLLGAVGVPLTLSLPYLMQRVGDRAWLPGRSQR